MPPSPSAAPLLSPVRVVDALEGKFGVSPGQRRNHSKGFCFTGEFRGTAEARALSTSALFGPAAVPFVGRFSLAGGKPDAADNAPNSHGMALRFELPGGGAHQMAMLDIPFFEVATPEGFLAKQLATTADPATGKPDPAKVAEFERQFPESLRLKAALMSRGPVPDGYEHTAFNSIHTFWLVDGAGVKSAVRWQFEPTDGVRRLSGDEAKSRNADFLFDGLRARLRQGPVQWRMQLTLAAQGDALNDPSLAWTGPHKTVDAGTLKLMAVQSQADGQCAGINFDPTVLSAGVEPSDDPVLKFRSPAYAVSFGRRVGEKH